jgi:hypothetical protein
MWWFGYGLYAVRLGEWYVLGGWLFNTIVLVTVTFMTEDRMLSNWDETRVEKKVLRVQTKHVGMDTAAQVPGTRSDGCVSAYLQCLYFLLQTRKAVAKSMP